MSLTLPRDGSNAQRRKTRVTGSNGIAVELRHKKIKLAFLCSLGRPDDRRELVLQPAGEVVKVWTMIGIDDHGDGEYASVGQDLEVDGRISGFANADRDGGDDLVAA
jgi:hypothetical protein